MDSDSSLDRILRAVVKDSGEEPRRCGQCRAELVVTIREATREPGKGPPEVQVKAHCPAGCKEPLYRSH